MCIAEWSWRSKSKPFVCSSLKPASKIQQDEQLKKLSVIGYLITCCKKNKLNCQVVMSYDRQNNSKSMHIVNSIILILMLLMIAIFTVDRFNQT
jgi:predicted nucleic acid-binding Zn ribbon protein